MATTPREVLKLVAGVSLALGSVWMLRAGQPATPAGKAREGASPAVKGADPAAVAKAREQAELLHSTYAATLEAMHHHYFRRDRAVVPARAMEDVFEELAKEKKIKARWIAVNTKPMSLDHEAKGEIDEGAVKALSDGKSDYEVVKDGYYHRAGAIPLGSGCVNCHVGFFAKPPKTPRVAGLVISVPLPRK